ncbi:uncharacterized protein ACDP82_015351 [Pangshura tecta]
MAQSERSSVAWTPGSGSLVPHKDAPGTDVFLINGGVFIVRSDLGCYLRTEDLKTGTGIEIRRLHPACRGGDHYLSDMKDPHNIYIIKGDSYRVVKDLSTDDGATVGELHPNCRGGDHYMTYGSNFSIIFLERGVMRCVLDLSTDEQGHDTPLKPDRCKGLYYFGFSLFQCHIEVDEKWGAQCYLFIDIASVKFVFSIHPDVLNFFPGGLALTQGASTSS